MMDIARKPRLRLALVGGPAYDPLYQRLPDLAAKLRLDIEIAATAPHQELNALVAAAAADRPLPFDLISTHIKYAPSQRAWLHPLDDLVDARDLAPFIPSTLELCRFDGMLWQLPRNVDARLLHVRRDWLASEEHRDRYANRFQRELRMPESWAELADIAAFFSNGEDRWGFAFPGRSSGLFGTFYELLGMQGGILLSPDLDPVFDSPEGAWALGYLRDLYLNGSVPPALPGWHFDEVSAAFRDGTVAMIGDWPGYFGLHRDPAHSVAAQHLGIARYPLGSTGTRQVYAGSHSFAITRACRDIPAAVALLHELTSFESQYFEAEQGVFPARHDALQAIRQSIPAGTLEAARLQLLELTVRDDMLMFPEMARYPEIEDAVWPMLQAGITGDLAISVALSRAVAATRAIVRTP